MAINDATLTDPARLNIAWVNSNPPPDARRAFAARAFSVQACELAQLSNPAYLSGLGAVVFTQDPNRLRAVMSGIQDYVPLLLAYGCHVIARPAKGQLDSLTYLISQTDLAAVASVGEILPFPYVRIYDESVSWDFIANFVHQYPPGRSPNLKLSPDIEPNEEGIVEPLFPERILLLQRAFADCEKVHLKPLPGGLSGAKVYVAYPTLKMSYNIGRQPLPYFVKMDARDNVLKEYKNYQERVDPYIPFHLGPHLIGERCFLGARDGVIVGDYVEESESLVDCARAGRAAHAIACLFNRTLHGWYRDARENSGHHEKYPTFPDDIPPDRWKRAKSLGAKTKLKVLRERLSCCNSEQMMVGPIHGDLNGKNVRVRGADAIVIDFLWNRDDGDVLYDAANLEASLFVDGFAKDHLGMRAALKDIKQSLESIWPIYRNSMLSLSPPHPDPENPSCWFYECVRQIRRYARQMECHPGQYAVALGRAFLKKACKNENFSEHEEYRRASAYVIAENLLLKTFPKNAIKSSAPGVVT